MAGESCGPNVPEPGGEGGRDPAADGAEGLAAGSYTLSVSRAVGDGTSNSGITSADALAALRQIILAADPAISEGIKWKVPSFHTSEYFATLHLRTKQGVGVILHFGAKPRAGLAARTAIKDEGAMLAWLADDRAVVAFADLRDVQAKAPAFTRIVQ